MMHLGVALLVAASAAPQPPPLKNTTGAREEVRIVVGGSLQSTSPILEYYRGFPPGGVKYITAAGTNPVGDGASIGNFFANAGIEAEWIPVHAPNCEETAFDPEIVAMVEAADAIYMSGGQAGRVQSCLYGDYSQSGRDPAPGESTPLLDALRAKTIIGGSSAGAMNQPVSEILITGHSSESYGAVAAGSVFLRSGGNAFLDTAELVDVHFSERGRQGRLMVMAMETQQQWAFGVDENTAYVWRPSGEYEVVGENGVVVYQDTEGNTGSQRAFMHFLTAGDRITPSTGQITFAPDKTQCGGTGPAPPGSTAIFSGVNYRTISIGVSQAAPGASVDSTHGLPAVQVRKRHFCDAT
jgi:cyanophycinase